MARRADLLTFQVDEIERAELAPGEDEELAQERIAADERGAAGQRSADGIYSLLIVGAR